MAQYLTIVFACMMGSCPIRFDDQKGFHTGPQTVAVQSCYLRGAEMIKDLTARMPVLFAYTICIDVSDLSKPKLTPAALPKPKTLEPADGAGAMI